MINESEKSVSTIIKKRTYQEKKIKNKMFNIKELFTLKKRSKREISNECNIESSDLANKYNEYSFKRVEYQKKSSTHDEIMGNILMKVDGCSFPNFANKIYPHRELYESSCNGHDVCYNCGDDKKECDNEFKKNMIKKCRMVYSERIDFIKKYSCIAHGKIIYSFVNIFGQKYFDEDHQYIEECDSLELGDCGCSDFVKTHLLSKKYNIY